MNKVTGRFFAPCRRNKETKQPSGLPRLFLRFCMDASLVGAAAGPASRRPRGRRKVKQLKERTDSSQIGAV